MRSPGINGEGELKGNRLTQVHLQKWPLKRSVCVCARAIVETPDAKTVLSCWGGAFLISMYASNLRGLRRDCTVLHFWDPTYTHTFRPRTTRVDIITFIESNIE